MPSDEGGFTWVWVVIPLPMDTPSAIFDSYDQAVAYIDAESLACNLYRYPLNASIYDYRASLGLPDKPFYQSREFRQLASPGHLEHEHFNHPQAD